MKKTLISCLLLILLENLKAQIISPVKWSDAAKKPSNNEAVLFLRTTIESPWHFYSTYQKDGGPVKKYAEVFKMDVHYFEKSVVFQQKIKLKAKRSIVKGKVEFMACNDEKRLPPDEVEFSIPVK